MSQDLLKHMVDIPADLQLCCLRLLNAKPGVENELRLMYDLSSVAGVKAVLKDHEFLPRDNGINVYGGTANLYFGCTFGGTPKATAKKGSKKDPSWQASDKLFLHDVWVSKVFKPLKDASVKLTVLNGVSMCNNATERLLGGDLKSFGKIHANKVANSVHTSKVLHGRGPEGYLELAVDVMKKAVSEGLITEPLSSSSAPAPTATVTPPASASAATPPTSSSSSGGGLAGIDLTSISFHGNG